MSPVTAPTTRNTAAAPPTVQAATLSAAFVTALRRAGLACSPDRAVRLAEALRLIPPTDVERLYWASALAVLGIGHIDAGTADRTLGSIVKNRDDLELVGARGADWLVAGTGG